eukprot:COSAG02_NODE_11670_length_1676_cov_4.497146_3_plen_49_part_00
MLFVDAWCQPGRQGGTRAPGGMRAVRQEKDPEEIDLFLGIRTQSFNDS